MKKKKVLKSFIVYILYTISIIIISFFSFSLIYKGVNSYITTNITYNKTTDVSYKVFLKENNFFETPYLEMNKSYISSLIDYIDINMNYKVNFSEPVSGSYTYYIKGTMTADKDNEASKESYWTKEYILKEVEKVDYTDKTEISINQSVKINYQEYNTILQKFKSEYGISFDGQFKVELVFDNLSANNNLTNSFAIKSTPTLTIPLTEKTLELTIDVKSDNASENVTEKLKIKDLTHTIYLIAGIVLFLIDVFLLINFIKYIKKVKANQDKYKIALKKILVTYDSIIVNALKGRPNLKNLKTINVGDFSELIDAHSETRSPITFYEEEPGKKSTFVLIANDIAWVYTLNSDELR